MFFNCTHTHGFPGPYARSLVCAGPAKPPFHSTHLDPRPLCLRPTSPPGLSHRGRLAITSASKGPFLDGEAKLAASLLAPLLLLLVLLALLLAPLPGPCIFVASCYVDLALLLVNETWAIGIGRRRQRSGRRRRRRRRRRRQHRRARPHPATRETSFCVATRGADEARHAAFEVGERCWLVRRRVREALALRHAGINVATCLCIVGASRLQRILHVSGFGPEGRVKLGCLGGQRGVYTKCQV